METTLVEEDNVSGREKNEKLILCGLENLVASPYPFISKPLAIACCRQMNCVPGRTGAVISAVRLNTTR